MKTFFARLRRDARNLDRGEALKPRVRIAFEDPADFLLVITPARIRLLRQIGTQSVAVNAVAKALSRDQSAVRRDIVALEAQRLLKTRKVSNPGHGTRTMVSRAAAAIELATVI
jgi:predicted transcriptional regulator